MATNVNVRLDDDLLQRVKDIQRGMQADPTHRSRSCGKVTLSDAIRETLLTGCDAMDDNYPAPRTTEAILSDEFEEELA